MLGRLREWLAGRLGGDESDDGDDGRFVPSVLDASVRYAHGMSDTGVEGEIADVEERARELEAHRER